MKRYILFLLLVFASSAVAQIQQVNSMAEARQNEIVVFLGKGIVSTSKPFQNITAYRIERKEGSRNNWTEVGESRAPATNEEFKRAFNEALSYFPQPHQDSPIPVDVIWQKILQHNNADSIAPYNFYLPVMLALGYATVDKNVKPKIVYQYRISHQINGNWQTAFVTNSVSLPASPKMPKAQSFKQFTQPNQIELTFLLKGENFPVYYQLLRRDHFNGAFAVQPVQKMLSVRADSLFVNIRDTLLVAHQAYEYVLAGYDRVGNRNIPSGTVTVASYNFNEATLPYRINTHNQNNVQGILLSWRLDNPELSRGLRLFRSEHQDKNFETIADLPPTDTLYIDQQVEPMKRYYYHFRILGVLGESSVTSATVFGMFQSSLAPLPPVNPSAVPEQQAIRLRWQAGDTDIKGYYVYRGITGESLEQVSPFLTDTTYLDSSQELSGRIFYDYAVRAENSSLHLSNYSDTVQVRPEIPTNPQRPRELMATVADGRIRLSWLDMKNLDNAIAVYEIERVVQQKVDTLFRWEENSFNDSTALRGIAYTYRVRAYDMFGGASDWSQDASIMMAAPSEQLFAPPGFQAFKGEGAITLRWGGSLQNGLVAYKIYRKTQGATPSLLATIEASQYEYTDRSVTKGGKYYYYITAVGNNKESERSTALIISYD